MLVTCVIAKTKTRSKNSSSGVTRSSRWEPSTAEDAIGSVHDENVARRLPHESRAHRTMDHAPQAAPLPDDDDSGTNSVCGGADLRRRIPDGSDRRHLHMP